MVGAEVDAILKRGVDLAVASTVLIVASPLFLGVALAVALDGPGGVFYRCPRVGRHGSPLSMLKFRKMHHGAAGVALTVANDERFTRTGRVLARTKLDELPQLWNVVRGDMSLVGPRPDDPGFVARRRADYAEILRVKPGITGLSQLAFVREAEIIDSDNRVDDYLSRLLPQKIALDCLYVRQRSTLMDVRILAWTAAAVVLRRSIAVDRSTGRLSVRRRPNGFAHASQRQLA